MFTRCEGICLIDDGAHHRHGTAAIDRAYDVTAGNVDEGVAAHQTRLRVVVFLTINTGVGVNTATSAIDITTQRLRIMCHHLVTFDDVVWICRIGNTDGTAIDVHRSALVVMTVLATAIDRALDVRRGQVAGTSRTDVDDGSVDPCHAVVRIHKFSALYHRCLQVAS